MPESKYQRPLGIGLAERLGQRPTRIQILAGPRQVGKTTLIRRLFDRRPPGSSAYLSVDTPIGDSPLGVAILVPEQTSQSLGARPDAAWLVDKWRQAAQTAMAWSAQASQGNTSADHRHFVLALDEIQKIPNWSETIKGLWDSTMASHVPIHLVLLGSSPLLLQRGLTESLAGRFELLPVRHWSYAEMTDAFHVTLEQYIYFGGYPGSIEHLDNETRWRDYVRHSLIQPNIERDILELTRVDKPALLKQLFELGCQYSGQIVALDKIVGTLQDAGNTVTLSRYLDLLHSAQLLVGLQKYAHQEIRRRKSPPKFQVQNTALVSALAPYSFDEARADRSYWERLVESAVGAHLVNTCDGSTRIHYWREGVNEVDFIVQRGRKLAAIEVKSGKSSPMRAGLDEFCNRHSGCRRLVVGSDATPIDEFLRYPADHWV